MANKLYSSKIVQRIDVNFATTPITANSYITVGQLPANLIITDGWAVIKTELGDADAGDDTTMSIGYTGAAAALYAATAITNMNAGVYLKLLPGVINIVAAQAITTVDTPEEAVSIARASADTFTGKVLTTTKDIILTASNDQNINDGTMSIFIEYLKF